MIRERVLFIVVSFWRTSDTSEVSSGVTLW